MIQTIGVYAFVIITMISFGSLAAKRVTITHPDQQISFYKWEILFLLLFFAIVFGMRYDVGKDHLDYLNSYLTGERVDRYEWGFRMITISFAKIKLHYTAYFGVLAFLQIYFFFYAFKDERYLFPFLVFILFTGGYYLSWMNGIRQDLAACVFIFAIKYIYQKQFLKYLIWCTIGFLFHKSAIILIIFYPIFVNGRDYFRNILLQISIFLVSLFVYYSYFRVDVLISPLIDIFASWFGYEYYTTEFIDDGTTGLYTGIGFILANLIDFLIIVYSKRIKTFFNSQRFTIIYNLYFVGIIVHLILSDSPNYLLRPFRYFIFF